MSENISINNKIIKMCTYADCNYPYYGLGYCIRHYTRLRRYGNANYTKTYVGVGFSPIERFWSKVAITANPNKCWE